MRLFIAGGLFLAITWLVISSVTEPAPPSTDMSWKTPPVSGGSATHLGSLSPEVPPPTTDPIVETPLEASRVTAETAKPNGVARPAPRNPSLRHVEGSVVALADGTRYEGLDGSMLVQIIDNHGTSLRKVTITGGRYAIEAANPLSICVHEAQLDGLALQVGGSGSKAYNAGFADSLASMAHNLLFEPNIELPWVVTVTLTVLDRSTGAQVSAIEIFEPDTGLPESPASLAPASASPHPHDGTGGTFSTGHSPVTLSSHSQGSRTYWVRAKDRAWARVDAFPQRPGQRGSFELSLDLAANVRVSVAGLPWEGALLEVTPLADSSSVPLRFPLPRPKFSLEGFPVGATRFSIVVDERVLATTNTELVTGADNEVALDLTQIEIPVMVHSIGKLVIAPEWQAKKASRTFRDSTTPDISLLPKGGTWKSESLRVGFRFAEVPTREVRDGREYTLDVKAREGEYTLKIPALEFATTVSIHRNLPYWRVDILTPIDWTLYTIDARTHEPVAVSLEISPGGISSKGSDHTFKGFGGPISVRGWGENHYVSALLDPAENGSDIFAQPLNSLRIDFVSPHEKACPVPAGLTIASVDGKSVVPTRAIRNNGVYAGQTPFLGRCRVVAPESADFEPVDQVIDIQGDVDVTITLKPKA